MTRSRTRAISSTWGKPPANLLRWRWTRIRASRPRRWKRQNWASPSIPSPRYRASTGSTETGFLARRHGLLGAQVGKGAGELGAVQEDLRRVIHPQQRRQHRAGGAEAGGDGGAAQVDADGHLADGDHQRGGHRTDDDVV